MSHPIRDLLVSSGYSLADAGEYWRTTAHFRGGKCATSLAIHKRTGQFRDFSNGFTGTAEQLVKIIRGESVDFSGYEAAPEQEKLKIPKVYPKECLQRLLPQFEFFKQRGISESTLNTFQAGMAHAGKLNRRICFPIYDRNSRIVGFAGRWFKEVPFGSAPKWKLLGDKKSWLFPNHLNEPLIREAKEIIVVESIGDLIALWDAGIKNTMCIFGISMSSKQLSYIMGLDPNRILISTNNDTDNDFEGQKAARKMQTKLRTLFCSEKVIVHLPTKKDFGVMTPPEIQSWYAAIPNPNRESTEADFRHEA